MRKAQIVIVVALVALSGACSKSEQKAYTCNSKNCFGCCVNNTCMSGSSPSSCGSGGALCSQCPSGQTCTNAKCISQACGPANCSGCCQGNTCVNGTSALQCGRNGASCVSCGAQICDNATCKAQTCGPANCPDGCCKDNICNSGNTKEACGTGGQTCQVCASGVCDQGKCSAGNCASGTCTGCCFGANCINVFDEKVCQKGAAGSVCLEDKLEPNDICGSAPALPTVEEFKGFVVHAGLLHGKGGAAEQDFFTIKALEGFHLCKPGNAQCSLRLRIELDVPAGRRLKVCVMGKGCGANLACQQSSATATGAHTLTLDYFKAGKCGLDDHFEGTVSVLPMDNKGSCDSYILRARYDLDESKACP